MPQHRVCRIGQSKRLLIVQMHLCAIMIGLAMIAYGQVDQVGQLISQLSSPDANARYSAAFQLGKAGDRRAVLPLFAALKDGNNLVRDAAANALDEINAPYSMAQLLEAFGNSNEEVRLFAIMKLGDSGDGRAVEPLITALKDPNLRFHDDAVVALGKIKEASAIEPLIAALKEDDEYVRRDAIAALVNIGTPAIEPLTAALRDPDPGIRYYAAEALGKFSDPEAASIAQQVKSQLKDIASDYRNLIAMGQPGSEDLLTDALDRFGTLQMAEDFLNSGNTKLEKAAERWGRAHGYQPQPISGGSRSVCWGCTP